ncbi:MAG: SGNH/GDSL hydrolase family protein, partial [Woeseia sp.]
MRFLLITLLLSPLLFLQGRWTRARTPRLPEADGAREGIAGNGPLLRLLILGDSAAAGVGASDQRDALAGQLVAQLADRYTVRWKLSAATGNKTSTVLEGLPRADQEAFDVAVVSLGVNDVTGGVTLDAFERQQNRLLSELRQRFGVRCIVLSTLPPMHLFPALPQPLRWVLGQRARQFSAVLRRLAEQTEACSLCEVDISGDETMMAEDGFHPGPPVYKRWAAQIAGDITRRFAQED